MNQRYLSAPATTEYCLDNKDGEPAEAAGEPTRRSMLTAGAIGALGLGTGALVSGCSGSSGPSGSTSPSADGGSASAGSAGATSAGGGSAGGGSAGGAGAAIKLADIPVGGAVVRTIGGKPVALAQPTAGKVVAFSAVCTHQGCPVAASGATLVCPCHASVFNANDGSVEKGPAASPLPAVQVNVSNGAVTLA